MVTLHALRSITLFAHIILNTETLFTFSAMTFRIARFTIIITTWLTLRNHISVVAQEVAISTLVALSGA